jgi:hypothetical protein
LFDRGTEMPILARTVDAVFWMPAGRAPVAAAALLAPSRTAAAAAAFTVKTFDHVIRR